MADPNAMETNPYDAVDFPGVAYMQAHPDRLAVMAILNGLTPAPVDRCRVLEIGCHEGRNLLPMAYRLPRSSFTGIDLAENPIVKGRSAVDRLGLKNVTLRAMNLMDIDAGFGVFDYILVHGIYSWVPDEVRDRLLAVCRNNLAPNGVAFLSYNAMPGGHLRRIVRDAMVFDTRGLTDPDAMIRRGKEFSATLVNLSARTDVFDALLRQQDARVQRSSVLYHDDLTPAWRPIYFLEFASHAARHGLQFLSEAQFTDLNDPNLSADSLRTLQPLAAQDPLRHEQYVDFLRMREFRQSLVCHVGNPLRKQPPHIAVEKLWISSPARVTMAGDILRFSPPGGGPAIRTNHPQTLAVLHHLIERWPQAEHFEALLRLMPDRETLSRTLLSLAVADGVHFHSQRPDIFTEISERPEASAVARYEATEGDIVTTVFHSNFKIPDEAFRQLLLLLDGTRTLAELPEGSREKIDEIRKGLLVA